jgi:hypothetical protein
MCGMPLRGQTPPRLLFVSPQRLTTLALAVPQYPQLEGNRVFPDYSNASNVDSPTITAEDICAQDTWASPLMYLLMNDVS